MLPNEKAILLIRGEKPVIDFKYDILKHPNVQYTADGNEKYYEYGVVDKSIGEIEPLTFEELSKFKNSKEEIKEVENISYEILSEEDIENYVYKEKQKVEK